MEKKYNIKSDASVYIDSLIDTINLIDAKKKEFKESDVNRDEDGKFAKKNSSNNKSNDATSGQTPKKDNDKKDNDKIKIKKIDREFINNSRKISSFIRELFHNETYRNRETSKELAEDYLKKLNDDNPISNILKQELQDYIDGNEIKKASQIEIDKAIESLPEGQRKTANYVYNAIPIFEELWDKHIEHNSTKATKKLIYNDLDNGAKTMVGFSSIQEYNRYSKEDDAEIIDLINKNPHPKKTVYRGEQLETDIKNLKIGQTYHEIKGGEIYSSNASYEIETAFQYAVDVKKDGLINVMNVFVDTKHINGYNFSYYKDEDECYIDKREQILDNIYQDERGYYYLIYKHKEEK